VCGCFSKRRCGERKESDGVSSVHRFSEAYHSLPDGRWLTSKCTLRLSLRLKLPYRRRYGSNVAKLPEPCAFRSRVRYEAIASAVFVVDSSANANTLAEDSRMSGETISPEHAASLVKPGMWLTCRVEARSRSVPFLSPHLAAVHCCHFSDCECADEPRVFFE
jgi:hypothetical protein